MKNPYEVMRGGERSACIDLRGPPTMGIHAVKGDRGSRADETGKDEVNEESAGPCHFPLRTFV